MQRRTVALPLLRIKVNGASEKTEKEEEKNFDDTQIEAQSEIISETMSLTMNFSCVSLTAAPRTSPVVVEHADAPSLAQLVQPCRSWPVA